MSRAHRVKKAEPGDATRGGKKGPKKADSEPPPKASAVALADCESFYGLIEAYLHENSAVEMSTPITAATTDLAACTDLDSVFAVPLRHRLFSMETALHWALFLGIVGREPAGDEAQFSTGAPFSHAKAHELIESVYDLGVEATVWSLYGDSEDDSEDADPVSDA